MTGDADPELLDGVAGMVFAVEKPGGRPSDGTARESRRSVVETDLAPRDHPLPVPNGWYASVASSALGDECIVSLRAVARDLVVFRDAGGAAHVFDAHCPHLGAHLGGGRVVGDRIACPYHGWQYGPDGACLEIPYNEGRIPERARVRSYPSVEKDGFVWFWYHAADLEPDYEVPDVPEVSDPGWSDAYPWGMDLVAALQEMAENNVDYAHFQFVHHSGRIPLESSEFHTDGPRSWVVERMGGGLTFTRHSYGPGLALLRVPDAMTMVAATTPIDRGNCRLQWHFYFPKALEETAEELIETVTGTWGLQADVPIWRDKVYRERPVYVKADSAIAEFRRWYEQFYDGAP